MCNGDYLPEEYPRDTEKCADGYRLELRVFPSLAFDERLFCNRGSFNDDKIEVILKTDIPAYDTTLGLLLSNISEHGIIIAQDADEGQSFGFRNFLVPWAQIAFIEQQIKT